MMRSAFFKRSAALLCAVLLLFTLAVPAFAEGELPEDGAFFAVGYRLSVGSSMPGRLGRGSTADITVTVKNVSLTADTFSADQYDFSKLIDSFSEGTVKVSEESKGSDPLVIKVRFSRMKYSGSGQSLRFQITRKDTGVSQLIELTIAEAGGTDEKSDQPAPEPQVLVSCSGPQTPLEPGQEAEFTVSFRNLSDLELKSPVASFTPSESLSISGGSYSFLLDPIKGKQTGSVKVKLKASDSVSSPAQSLQADLKFTYFNNVSEAQATASDKLPILTIARGGEAPPVVLASRSTLKKPIAAGETASLTVTFSNKGDVKLLSPVASFTPSDALLIESDAGSVLLPDLDPGQTASVSLTLRALPEITSANQSIQADLKFTYSAGGTMTQGSSSDRLSVPANPTGSSSGEGAEASVPHIVVSDFSYGGESVDAGSNFELKLHFENKGTLPIENILLMVDGGENFTLSGGSSSFFFASLAPGAGQDQILPLQALPAAKSGAQSVALSFKYEYVDGSKRGSGGEDIKLSMPVVQPDRFEISSPQIPESINVGEETVLTIPYVNKGKSEIANVEASVTAENIDTPTKSQYIGNIAAGAGGNIGFVLTPEESGPIPLVLKITYEDSNEKVQEKEISVEIFAEELPMDPIPDGDLPPEDGEGSSFHWTPVLGGTGAAAVFAGGGVLFALRGKKKKQQSAASWSGWDDPDDEEALANWNEAVNAPENTEDFEEIEEMEEMEEIEKIEDLEDLEETFHTGADPDEWGDPQEDTER